MKDKITEKKIELYKKHNDKLKALYEAEEYKYRKKISGLNLKEINKLISDIEEDIEKQKKRQEMKEEDEAGYYCAGKKITKIQYLALLKEDAIQEAQEEKLLTSDYSDYSLKTFSIIGYIRNFHNFENYENFDKKHRGYFLQHNILATGGGYFLLQQFWYAQWRSKEYSTCRKNYFICGWNEKTKYFFSHSIPGQVAWNSIKYHRQGKTKWWEYIFNYIFDNKLDKIIYRQGEIGLIKAKNVEGERIGEKVEIQNHIIIADEIYKNESYFVRGKGKIIHKFGRHEDIVFEDGIYKIIVAKETDIWDFGRKKD